MDNNMEITGAGGKGGGGSGAVEAANTLRSSATVSVVEVISEGEIVGICGGAKGIYLNDTPLQAPDGTYNFPRAAWDYRVGLPSQDYMQGFSDVEAEITVGTVVTAVTPITHTTSSPTVDAVKVTITLPSGLYVQDTTNGNMNGTTVSYVIDSKLTSSGSWTNAQNFTIDGKTTSPYERQYRIERPAGSGTWDVRVTRTTADSTVTSLVNATTFSRLTEIQEIKTTDTEYLNTAVVGISIDAQTVGNAIPNRAYLVKGIKVQIPSNYDPVARTYSGTWNGTFTTAWTDNPAWVLYDLLTNVRYGMGAYITANQVDKYSFYDASVYNDATVATATPTGTTYEPRFSFNAVIADRTEGYRLIQLVAGAMRGTLVYVGGLVTLLQDRPSSPVRVITKSNVIDGMFDYKSTGIFQRHTAFNVTFNDRTDRHLQHVTTIDASTQSGAMQTMLLAAQNIYGYTPTDIAAFGATTESQAIRQGRWALDTELNQTDLSTWKMSLNGFDLRPGDIVKVYDEDYAATVGGGRIVSVSGTTVVLDRPVTLTAGSTLDVMLADGKTLESKAIVQISGTVSTFTIASAFSQSVLAGADYIVTTTASARQFKLISIKQQDISTVTIEAAEYDPNKFSRVETGVSTPAPLFSNAVVTVTSVPTNLTFKESSVNIDNSIKRSLLISWGYPATGVAASYTIMYRCNLSTWTTISDFNSMSYELVNIQAGTYDVKVVAVTAYGVQSQAVSGTYTINAANAGTSTLNAPTTLVEQNGNGTAFLGYDLNFKWTNPSTNATVTSSTLRDFEVRIIETTGSTTLRTFYVPAVAAGSVQNTAYTYAMNGADSNNVPRRTLKVEVRCRDTNGNLSSAAQTTFSNAAPAIPSNIAVVGGLQSTKFTFTTPADVDFAGVLIWGSTTTGFTPSSANLLYDGKNNYIAFNALTDLTAYYYKIAAYDTFGKDYAGTGLNVSTQYTATTVSAPGVNSGATLPGTSTEGTIFFDTTDGQLYRWHSGAWTAAVPAVNVTGTLTDSQIAAVGAAKITGQLVASQITDATLTTAKFASGIEPITVVTSVPGTKSTTTIVNTTDGKLYRWNGSAYVATVATTDLSGTLADAQLAAIAASKITGTLTDSQLAAIGAAKITGSIVGTQITDGAISTAKLAAGAVTAATIAADTITASQIAANAITSSELAAGAVTAGKITAGTIIASDIAAGTITGDRLLANTITASQIAANTITATQLAANTITAGQIAAGAIGATQIAAGAITTGKLVVTSTAFLNADPYLKDSSLWYAESGSMTMPTISDAPVGNVVIRTGTGGPAFIKDPIFYPIDITKTYRFRFWVRGVGANGILYQDLQQYTDSAGSTCSTNGGRSPYKPGGVATPTSWTEYSNAWGPSDWQSGVKFIRLDWLLNYSGSAGYVEICFPRFEEMVSANLIVDGTITATQIAAGTITATQIAADTITASQIAASAITSSELAAGAVTASKITAGTITSNEIAANTITAGQIAAATITGSNIAAGTIAAGNIIAGSITGDRIAAGTITGSLVAANSITASNIDSRSLTIKDAGGTVIFGSGTNLTSSYITPASGWLNSNLSIGSNGVLSGGGGGTVTIGGLGFYGDLNATYGANWATNVTGASTVNGNIATAATTANYANLSGTPSTAIANSAISIASNGVLSGGGGGTVTIGGLGYYGALNATANQSDATTNGAIATAATTANYSGLSGTVPAGWLNSNVTTLYSVDTRTTNALPGTYAIGLTQEFKQAAYVGSPPTADTYGSMTTEKVWSDSSGGAVTQMFKASDGVWKRTSNSGWTGWTAWSPVLDRQISSSNISTYIAGAAIGSAYIGVLAAGNIGANTIDASKIVAGSITATQIASSTITASQIAAGTIVASNIVTGTLTATQINGGALTSTYAASAGHGSSTVSVSVTIPSGARSIVAMATYGSCQQVTGSGENASYYDGPVSGTITSTSSIVTGSGMTSCVGTTSNPTAGTYTITTTRATASVYYGNITIVVFITNR